ncbi:MAG TPA: response regulator transcription factor [Gemmatimonadaceae bacterium]|nr:response regulator transcription factor [Gemmatimonadaceae bacterium]
MADGRPSANPTTGRPRVALLADVRLYREGLVRELASSTAIEILGGAAITEAGLAFVRTSNPDVVLLEATSARTPAVVRAILSVAPEARVIAFAVGDEERDAILCAEAGVSGYVSQEASIDDVVDTIMRVAHGEFPCSPRVVALLARRVSALAAQREPDAVTAALTSREREILRLIDGGLSNKEIAQRLGIGLSTVKNHVHSILRKTRAPRRGQAAARARGPAWIKESMPVQERI